MPSLITAVNLARSMANDPTYGYDQTNRYGPDYDCSSFVCYCLSQAGFNVNPTDWTGVMYADLIQAGFVDVTSQGFNNLMAGDVLLNTQHHTAIMVSNTDLAEAVHNENYPTPGLDWYHGGIPGDQTGDEIRIRSYYWYSSGWDYVLRYPNTLQWIAGNRYLNQSEMENNAQIIYYYFKGQGWSDQAISAMVGNMQAESTVNPALWEGLTPYGGGYGLVQWTPYTKFSNWYGTGWETAYDAEMQRIIYEMNNGLQWDPARGDNETGSGTFYQTFQQFSTSQFTPTMLANQWCYKYEYPATRPQPIRGQYAEAWYQYFTGLPPTPPGPTPPSHRRKGFPIWLLNKKFIKGLPIG